MRQALQLRALQQLTLNPQLVQSVRLLQLSALEFEQEIEEALAANPFLECDQTPGGTGDEAPPDAHEPAAGESAGEPAAEDRSAEMPDAVEPAVSPGAATGDAGDEAEQAANLVPCPHSLREHLLEQVNAARLSDRDRALVAVLVDALDGDGYLRQTLDEIRALLPAEHAVEPDELRVAAAFLRSLDPPGIGAHSLAECLQAQLAELPRGEPGRDLALAIVRDHLQTLASHDTPRLLRALGCGEAALREANALIRRLDPRPGARFSADDVRYVVADVVVRAAKGRWVATINPDAVPRIRVNRLYAAALRGDPGCRGGGELVRELQEARWLVRNVAQRFVTIQRVAQAIVDRQRRFLEHGELAMRPLVVRAIAAELGLHPSTVSRVTCNKHMATPRGVIPFKRFFSAHVTLDEGAACASAAVRALVREIIAAEDARTPLSDVDVTRMLGTRGIRLARRTVTKYRMAMKIPPVEARRLAAP